jgi:hypothetical protein
MTRGDELRYPQDPPDTTDVLVATLQEVRHT